MSGRTIGCGVDALGLEVDGLFEGIPSLILTRHPCRVPRSVPRFHYPVKSRDRNPLRVYPRTTLRYFSVLNASL